VPHARHSGELDFDEEQRVRCHKVQDVLAVACGPLQKGHPGLVNLACLGRAVISLGTRRGVFRWKFRGIPARMSCGFKVVIVGVMGQNGRRVAISGGWVWPSTAVRESGAWS
jgi:hypothetical protein